MTPTDSALPLVATLEFGGPYDSSSYMAGWEMGSLQEMLAQGPTEISISVRAENLRQADLLSMAYGYILKSHDFRGGIVSVEIYKAAPDPESG